MENEKEQDGIEERVNDIKTVFICQHETNMCIECAITMNSVTAERDRLKDALRELREASIELDDIVNARTEDERVKIREEFEVALRKAKAILGRA